jgi:hypothetical protein
MHPARKSALTWLSLVLLTWNIFFQTLDARVLSADHPAVAQAVIRIQSTIPATLPENNPDSHLSAKSRGYLTTPDELNVIAQKAAQGKEPYHSSVAEVLQWAQKSWDYPLTAEASCPNSDNPAWIDNGGGIPRLYARALAYHLTGEEHYAREAAAILERIMTEVKTISISEKQCRLNFSWGTPELVASADLLESYWHEKTCTGPISTLYGNNELSQGPCKKLFQNWLVKNPYYIVSLSAESAQSNWGASGTNTIAYIADFLWDRSEVKLISRTENSQLSLSPKQAFERSRQLALDRMNGYRVELESSNSCDYLSGSQQDVEFPKVKSQITELGIIPEDARRDEYCNIIAYDGAYQNYPQLHLGSNIQQCELLLRRGDSSCYDNVSQNEINFTFVDPGGTIHTTTLHKGRGSIERAIKSIIVDSKTEWKKDSSLEVAYRYYFLHHTLPGFEKWAAQLDSPTICAQDICFGRLTHGFALNEIPTAPPTVPPPQ